MRSKAQQRKRTLIALLSPLLLAPLAALAAETLPPLKSGKLPVNLDELWAGFDPRKEPLETEVLKEWEQDGAVCREESLDR